ncbi:MAG: peptidoglycan editing factor PgeF [Nitrospirota bacterium]|nr:peptidoglycan editing factor PgeF [Nitrospirota bacterium]
MHNIIIPDNIKSGVSACFTGKNPGADTQSIAEHFGITKTQIYFPIQKHTDKILVIETSPEPAIADAVITRQRGLLIGVQVADCVPILLCDPERQVVGAVHAGWRGTAQEILKKTIHIFCERFFSDPARILIAIGPSIRQCCYEVDGDVIREVSRATGDGAYFRTRGDKCCLDLAAANKVQALSMGLSEGNVWISDDCTSCSPEKFFSYRFSKGLAGRQAGIIGII